MLKEDLILYSCGSHLIVEYEELCHVNNINVVAIVKNQIDGPSCELNSDKVVTLEGIDALKGRNFICPLFTPKNRFFAVNEAQDNGLHPFSILSHHKIELPSSFKHGTGCFINKGVVIGARTSIGNHVLINRGACLGHDLNIEDFVSIGPGVTTGGNIEIKKGALLGTGSVILPKIVINQNAIIGAGAVVTKHVESRAIMVGNPAKKIGMNTECI